MVGSPRDGIARSRGTPGVTVSAARSAFEGCVLTAGASGAALGLSAASMCSWEFPRSIHEMERAHAVYRSKGDGPVRSGPRAHWVTPARNHGRGLGDRRWIARAKTLLVDQPDSSERGWVALTEGMFERARAIKEQHYARALDIGRRLVRYRARLRHAWPTSARASCMTTGSRRG